MRVAARVFAVFAALLGGSTLVLVLMDESALSAWLLGGAALASLVTAAGLWLIGAAVPDSDPDEMRLVPDVSYATAGLAIGACLVVFGLVFDVFMVLIGAGVAVFALAGLVREQRAMRRAS